MPSSSIILIQKNKMYFYHEVALGRFDIIDIKGEPHWDLSASDSKRKIEKGLKAYEETVGKSSTYTIIWWDGQEYLWKKHIESVFSNHNVRYIKFDELINLILLDKNISINQNFEIINIDNDLFKITWKNQENPFEFDIQGITTNSQNEDCKLKITKNEIIEIVYRNNLMNYDSTSNDNINFNPSEKESFNSKPSDTEIVTSKPYLHSNIDQNSQKAFSTPPGDNLRFLQSPFAIELFDCKSGTDKKLGTYPILKHRTLTIGRYSRTKGNPDIDLSTLLDDPERAKFYSRHELEIYVGIYGCSFKSLGKTITYLQKSNATDKIHLKEATGLCDGDIIMLGDELKIMIRQNT